MAQAPPPQGGYGAPPQPGMPYPVQQPTPYPPQGYAAPPPQGYPPQPPQGYPPQPAPPAAPPVTVVYVYKPPKDKKAALEFKGTREWEAGMCCICCKQPAYFCFGMCCPVCAVYSQRMKLLQDKIEEYICCAGIFGCEKCTGPCNGNACGLCLESFCCTFCAVFGNRHMVRSHYNLGHECCDTTILCLLACCHIIALLTDDDCWDCMAFLFLLIVMGCMMAQHEHQMQMLGYPWPEAQPVME